MSDVDRIIDGLQSGLDTVNKLAPLASKLGGGPVASLAGVLAGIASNALERAQEGRIVAQAQDVATIRALTAKLAAENDALAAAVAKS